MKAIVYQVVSLTMQVLNGFVQTKASGYHEQHDCRCMHQRVPGPSTAHCAALWISELPLHRALHRNTA